MPWHMHMVVTTFRAAAQLATPLRLRPPHWVTPQRMVMVWVAERVRR